VRFSCA